MKALVVVHIWTNHMWKQCTSMIYNIRFVIEWFSLISSISLVDCIYWIEHEKKIEITKNIIQKPVKNKLNIKGDKLTWTTKDNQEGPWKVTTGVSGYTFISCTFFNKCIFFWDKELSMTTFLSFTCFSIFDSVIFLGPDLFRRITIFGFASYFVFVNELT